MRIHDLEQAMGWPGNSVRLHMPLTSHNMVAKMRDIQTWADVHCKGNYIILMGTVIFEFECDALIFKLKYG